MRLIIEVDIPERLRMDEVRPMLRRAVQDCFASDAAVQVHERTSPLDFVVLGQVVEVQSWLNYLEKETGDEAEETGLDLY